jgi:membrane peptidoglycan carboxypeptidase
VKRGKMLGGRPPRRGGRLTHAQREAAGLPESSGQLLALVAVGCLVLGSVAGFAVGMDRQLRGGLLVQWAEAVGRSDWVSLDELPPHVPDAFLAVVDPRFETSGRFPGRGEGKTVPRELVRQIHLLGDGFRGEAKELVMAPVLEQRATERDLLELYLNRVHLGGTQDFEIYGVYHGAQEYFGKDPRELTLSEAATLAGILLEPRIDRPDEVSGAIGARRSEVLRGMLSSGRITPAEYAASIQERLGFQPGISEMPMSRRLPTTSDTMAIRLPPEYRPLPPTPTESE